MTILQLCVFTNYWHPGHKVTSIDLKNGTDIFNVTKEEANKYDLVCAAPPCDQFTKANSLRWEKEPKEFIKIATKCLELCKETKKYWFLENPPGRIETFIPELKNYRVITWQDYKTNKEYIIYANFLITQPYIKRYGRQSIKRPKITREKWRPDLIIDIQTNLNYGNPNLL